MTIATKTLTASVAVLVLTIIHHFYGAFIYDAPFRQHVAIFIIPVLLLMLLAYWAYVQYPQKSSGKVSWWIFMVLATVVPVGAIGLFEGGYNHLLKNALFFGGASEAVLETIFPPPTYEMPDDVWFELTGILQFFVGVYAGSLLIHMWRETRPVAHAA